MTAGSSKSCCVAFLGSEALRDLINLACSASATQVSALRIMGGVEARLHFDRKAASESNAIRAAGVGRLDLFQNRVFRFADFAQTENSSRGQCDLVPRRK
jgi:hypothetical protein